MKNSVFAVLLLSIILLSVAAVAQEGRYVRKKLTPNFFIPQSELERREVLPPFYYEEPKPAPKPKAVQQQPQPEQEEMIEVSSPQIETTTVTSLPKPFNIDEAIHSQYQKYNNQDLARTPEYQQKYNDYIRDLKFIAETGNYPENQTLNNDLAMMNSNDRIIVGDTFGIKPPEPPLPENTQKIEILDVYPGVEEENDDSSDN
ncbi:MAG: hypothetical protein J6A33_06320 [Alphaproteobacteria bacterium]|nr:hypothetical protein [Alphaproteobacteria bacterium]